MISAIRSQVHKNQTSPHLTAIGIDFWISVADANQLSLPLLDIIWFSIPFSSTVLAIIRLCNHVSQDLIAIIAFCIPKYKDFACLDWPGPTCNFPVICDVCCQLSLDVIAIIAVRFQLFLNVSRPLSYNCSFRQLTRDLSAIIAVFGYL